MILGYAETLRENPDLDEKTRTRFLDHIYTSSIRLNNLINDIIELHKLESVGEGFRVAEATSLADVVASLRAYYLDTGSKSLQLEADAVGVHILPEHLQSILTNLIDNALKYSEGEFVSARLTRDDGGVMICVDDQGPVIEESDRERIFERFYTCSRSRNKQHSGTGLGLSIVKHIANLYGGYVKIKINDDGGNCFTVWLEEKVIPIP